MRAATRCSGVCLRKAVIVGSRSSRWISSTRRRASSIASSSEPNFSLPTRDPCRTVTFQLSVYAPRLGRFGRFAGGPVIFSGPSRLSGGV
jgi:hypothetical protein